MRYFYQKTYYLLTGDRLVRRYSRSYSVGSREKTNDKSSTGSNPEASSKASISRALSKVRLLAFSNQDLVGLLTLTFEENIIDESEAQRIFDLFRRRVARLYKGWKFLGVKEYQKRGAIHYHLLVNFCPAPVRAENPKLTTVRYNCSLWTWGFSDFSFVHGDDMWRTELYLLKYLSKQKGANFKQKYVRSRGLKEAECFYSSDKINQIHPNAKNIFMREIKVKKPVFNSDGSLSWVFDKVNFVEYNYNVKYN